jgi:hypothetical protein
MTSQHANARGGGCPYWLSRLSKRARSLGCGPDQLAQRSTRRVGWAGTGRGPEFPACEAPRLGGDLRGDHRPRATLARVNPAETEQLVEPPPLPGASARSRWRSPSKRARRLWHRRSSGHRMEVAAGDGGWFGVAGGHQRGAAMARRTARQGAKVGASSEALTGAVPTATPGWASAGFVVGVGHWSPCVGADASVLATGRYPPSSLRSTAGHTSPPRNEGR